MGSQLASLQPDVRYDGVVGIWYGKAPGVDRASDALRHAMFAGTSTRGGAVALVGDDPSAKSSTVPSSSAGVVGDMHMPMLYPGDPAEALDLGRHAIALSRTTGLWVALKIVADVADATADVDLRPDRVEPVIPTIDGERYRHSPDGRLLTPHTIELEQEIVEVRNALATRYASDNQLNRVTAGSDDAWIGVVASGITYREVREAFARLGFPTEREIGDAGIRLLKMGMPFPFDPRTIRRFADGLERIVVIEEKRPTIESLIKDTLYDLAERPSVIGKLDAEGNRLVAEYGALDADAIAPVLRTLLSEKLAGRLAPPPPQQREPIPLTVDRTPFYCSGCPHNRSTVAPDGTLVGAGIGCHTMTLLMEPDRVGDIVGVTCMGSEGAQWVGMSEFIERDHFVQNVGDGTYFHSAQLAIQFAVASGVNITYKLLHNGAIAMTGGQLPQGRLEVPDIARVLLAQGVNRVLITAEDTDRYGSIDLPDGVDVWDRGRLEEAHETLAGVDGVTVLIHDQACAAENRRARKRGLVETPNTRVVINHRVCEGCGDCGEVSNCLSVQPLATRFGTKTTIDQTTCNYDYSCIEGDCPAFVTVTLADDSSAASSGPQSAPDPPQVPAPEHQVSTDDFAMRICGVGGTGVVTVAQVLGTAAMLDGFDVRGLDQTGLSQKAGPVVSDVRLSKTGPTATNRLGRAQADLLLAFDQLVAASPSGMLTADPEHTAVVGSTSQTPTGSMIGHHDIVAPSPEELVERIAERTLPGSQHWADAQAITEALFGRSTTANFFVVGMAVQAGLLPIDPARIDEAIGLNGVATDANRTAFAWGRVQVAAPDAVAAQVGDRSAEAPVEPPEAIADRIDAMMSGDEADALGLFANELIEWGDESTAAEWLDVVERVSFAETAVGVGSSALTTTVAANLFKLVAYKDEYEVARLMLDDDGMAPAHDVAGEGDRIAWKLHPPMLRALGMKNKVGVDVLAAPAIRALARGKRLRGTRLDPFGYTEVRRLERALPGEYVAAVDRVLESLDADNLDDAVALAGLPDLVRGYEDIKLRRAADYRTRLSAALQDF